MPRSPRERNVVLDLLGQGGLAYGNLLTQLAEAAQQPRRYVFMSPEDLGEQGQTRGVAWVNKIYWTEILQRAHLAALTSAVRHDRWFFGAVATASAENFLAFAACLRGLVEACSDSYYSLSTIGITFAENYGKITAAIQGTLDEFLLASEDVENKLLHFQFAGRHDSKNLSPVYRSRTAREYLNSIVADDRRDIVALYERLCALAHPADDSLSWLLSRPDEESLALGASRDAKAIAQFCDRHRVAILDTIQRGVNSDLLILKTLNTFSDVQLRTPVVDTVDLPNTPAWGRISRAIRDARGG